jgi:selenocysteine-specific elongation factor
MKSIIIGTAGHIDHGKTALVKALTGIDADRLAEEKRRGITIDLGFAHMELTADDGELLRLGFVDVPGHERFVRNMLAGVGGIDLVLLVIAADESIKPQTREHFDILQLLGVERGITVLTKSDTVDEEMLQMARAEVDDFVRGTFLEKSSIVAVSSLTGVGLADLKRAIVTAASEVRQRDSHAYPRLPIDRVFTMKGFGTVVTGTLIAGTIRKDDSLEVFPSGRRVRVRGVQVHGNTANSAIAGQRTALNVVGASTEDLSRGMMLAPEATFVGTRRLDVSLRLLPSASRAMKDRARVHFHAHTMETVGEVILYNGKQVKAGDSAYAQLQLAEPSLLLPGDRFILRQFSPVVTIGGGIVLDAVPILSPREVRKLERAVGATTPAFEQMRELFGSGRQGPILAARVTRREMRGLHLAEAVAETGLQRAEIEELAGTMGELVLLRGRMFARREFDLAQARLLGTVSRFHVNNPLASGMAKGEVQEELQRALKMAPELFDAALTGLVNAQKLEVLNEFVRLPGRGVVMKDEEAESRKKIEETFMSAGLKVPALPEVMASLKIDKVRAQKIVTILLREKVLIKVSDDLVFHKTALAELRRKIAAYKLKSAKIDVAQFKQMTDVTRKYAIPLLEYMDRERVTRRVGDAREIL